MSIKVRLIIMNFLQFFVWGSWLISLGGYMGRELHFEGGQIGAIFATMGIASLVMPGIIGIIADKWFNAERLYGLCHIAGAGCLFYASIRVWGTIGFICAMWAVDLTGFKNSSAQLYVGGASALLLGLYSFTLPACRPAKSENKSWLSAFGLDALVLFKKKKMAIFFLFSMLLGAALQITNTYGDLFLGSFASIPEYAVIHFTDVRNIVYSCHTFLPASFRNQTSHANQYVRLGVPVRPVRFWRSGIRTMDADPFHDCLWYGL